MYSLARKYKIIEKVLQNKKLKNTDSKQTNKDISVMPQYDKETENLKSQMLRIALQL